MRLTLAKIPEMDIGRQVAERGGKTEGKVHQMWVDNLMEEKYTRLTFLFFFFFLAFSLTHSWHSLVLTTKIEKFLIFCTFILSIICTRWVFLSLITGCLCWISSDSKYPQYSYIIISSTCLFASFIPWERYEPPYSPSSYG